MKPICGKCQIELRREKSGCAVIYMYQDPPQPYQIFFGDLWRCSGCAAEIISGFAAQAHKESHQPDFAESLTRAMQIEHRFCYERLRQVPK